MTSRTFKGQFEIAAEAMRQREEPLKQRQGNEHETLGLDGTNTA